MKKFLLYTLIFVLGISLTSCEDFLKEESYGNPTSEELLKDPNNMALLVGQAYAELKWLHDHWGYWGLNTLTSDEARCPVRYPGGHWSDGGYWANLNTMNWDYEGEAFQNVWLKCISGATLCNKILKQISAYESSVDPAMYKRFTAELCVLRSYYYYTMFDMFGRIPYTEQYPESETVQFPLLSREVVWKNIVNSLEANVPNLPKADEAGGKAMNYGRATQGFGYALLARLYLNAIHSSFDIEGIDESTALSKCITYCNKVINSGTYSIESNFFNNFLVYNENSNENIMVIVENGNANFDTQESYSMLNKLRINLLTQHYSFLTLYTLLEKPWNGFSASKAFMDLYEKDDRRGPCGVNEGTVVDFQNKDEKFGWFVGPVYIDGVLQKDENGDKVIIKKTYSAEDIYNVDKIHNWNDGARCMKYETEVASTVNKYMENDFVLMRYADVLYMKAEAQLRLNNECNEMLSNPSFQLIRTRAGLEPYTSLTLDELLDERGREFAWENVRRRDLIRFGKYTSADYVWDYKIPTDDSRKWFPIPKKQLELHKNDVIPWTQNEGY